MPSNLTDITDKQRNHCTKRFRSIAFLLIVFLISGTAFQTGFAQNPGAKKFAVTIDAGHGGHDTGAPGKKSLEKNIALGIALKVGHYIESLMDDVDVFYTRKTDVFVPLYERAQIANRNKSDVFISIHVNAIKNKTAPTGTSTYVMGFSKSRENLDLVMEENKAMLLEKDYQTNYPGFDPTSAESYILNNNFQKNNLTESLELARAVQDQLRTRGQRKDNGVQQGNLCVLWTCAKPAVLIETGFITNSQEEEFLMTENGQDIIASAIYMAFREYKETVDQKVGTFVRNNSSESSRSNTTIPKLTDSNKAIVRTHSAEIEQKAQEPEKRLAEPEKKLAEPEKKPAETEKKPADTVSSSAAPSGLEFRVQLFASPKKIPPGSKQFKGHKDLKEIEMDGYFKYMSEAVKTYQEALELRQKMAVSFQGAFIVAFKNGVKVPVNSVIDTRK